ncbi:hypothetical protein [Rickettsia bellii]|uniref:hypothetical protein n=1 Tax=Rickettsia bellii TaxID=33990 RepID=UPI00164F00F2|nr:hypothetical protein [Rickettsia bellii]
MLIPILPVLAAPGLISPPRVIKLLPLFPILVCNCNTEFALPKVKPAVRVKLLFTASSI